MRITRITIVFITLIGTIQLKAQQAHVNLDWAPQKNTEGLVPFGANTISPEVHDDHTVTGTATFIRTVG
jgi:hypothetical protein